jgi:carbamoyl-phosphate synthase large subunit
MNVAFDERSLIRFLQKAADVSEKHPVVISKFVENAREIEIDGVAKSGELVIYAITEHVESAGTHSGDATVVLPPQRTYLETVRRAKRIARDVIKELDITGPFNIQFLAKANHLQVIECNVRASRSFPFVSKATKYNFIDIAVRGMLGEKISDEYRTVDLDYVAVKSPQFSYGRIKGADPMSYVEMASTGEVACFGDNFSEALIKAMLASGMRLPKKGVLVSLGGEENKVKLLPALEKLSGLGLKLYATEQTAEFLESHHIKSEKVYKIITDKDPGVLPLIDSGRVDLIINIPREALARESEDGFVIRRKAVDLNISLITNRQLAEAFIWALSA